ncbi:MAG: release factor glutamine methyltransferase [Melioribacteraceae bacterium]|nr:MAG: release factor glutamine methyltransferase [Melioribacteraceae bacterium]
MVIMLTVLESLQLSTEYLEKKGIDSARMNAELLLADILNCGRLDLYLRFEQPLTDEEKSIYRDFISRRAKNEPLQYIIGNVEFFGMHFIVNENVLIPRQETEILVEKIIENNKNDSLRILDIGTGSGCIALSLAKNLPECSVTAIDISREALKVAWKNQKHHEIENCELKQFDIMSDDVSTLGKFDMIVSNPPYVPEDDYKGLQKEIVLHEPRIALTDDADGYKFYSRISNIAAKLLMAGGSLYFESGDGMAEKIGDVMKDHGLKNIKYHKDYLDISRVVEGQV